MMTPTPAAVIPPLARTHERPAPAADLAVADRPVALDVRGLSAGYGAGLALVEATFSVRQGERIALLGPNGAGKSTLFKAIMGLLRPAGGQVSIHGDPSPAATRRVAYVPQFEEVDWNFPVSVRDVVMMGRERHVGWFRLPRPGGLHHTAVSDALARVGLLSAANRQIGELSGGQKRRVFIARALAQEADILLLDEPFSGVDARAQEAIFGVLNELRHDGITVILATHDLVLASTHFDKLLLLNQRLLGFGLPSELFQPELLAKVFGGQLAIWRDGKQVLVVEDHCCP